MIEVGEYVRTKKDGICKLLNIENDYMWCGYVDKPFWLRKDNIVKHSKNIIDLIDYGDYVNGVEVQYVYGYDEDGNDLDGLGICEVDGDYAYYKYLEDITIHSIITKEQIKTMEYKVKE